MPDASVDFVVAGQAFHWFRPDETRIEFARILKPGGWAVLIWHDRNVDSTPFLRAYEAFVRRHSTDYDQVSHKYLASYAALERFFAPNQMKLIQQHNQQRLDFDGLRGRLLSSSYIPKVRRAIRSDAARAPATFLFPRRRWPRRLAVRHQDLLRTPRPMNAPAGTATGRRRSAHRTSQPARGDSRDRQ